MVSKNKYILKSGGCSLPNRVYPAIHGKNVKNGSQIFQRIDLENKFIKKCFHFDYLSLKNLEEPFMFDTPWKKVDLHNWISPGLLDSGAISYGISPKLKKIFDQYNLTSSAFYEAKLMYENEKHDFWVWQIKENSYLSFINWEASTFTDWNMMRTRKRGTKFYTFYSELDFLATSEGKFRLGFDKAIFRTSFKENDLCFFPRVFPAYTFIISERLKQAIESANIEGVVIKELPFEIEYSDTLNT